MEPEWPPIDECDQALRLHCCFRCYIHSVESTAVVSVWLPVAEFQSHTTWRAGSVIVAADVAVDDDNAVTGLEGCTARPDLGHGYRTTRTRTTTTKRKMTVLIDDVGSIRT